MFSTTQSSLTINPAENPGQYLANLVMAPTSDVNYFGQYQEISDGVDAANI